MRDDGVQEGGSPKVIEMPIRKLGSERESVEESILGGFLKSDEFDLGRSQTLCLE
jgi:hypothetical protein